MDKLRVLILAAGKGTRMANRKIPKVCHQILGRPMIQYVLDQALSLDPEQILVVVGYKHEQVAQAVAHYPVKLVLQTSQEGTAHAVMQAAGELEGFSGALLVLSGDVPLIAPATLKRLWQRHRQLQAAATILTAQAPDPSGYGRVLRTAEGLFDRIVEDKDADETVARINEINAGVYIFDWPKLREVLPLVDNHNAQHEYYLPDTLALLRQRGEKVGVEIADSFSEIHGVNTVADLQAVAAELEKRQGDKKEQH